MSFIPYQIDYSVQNTAKTIGFSKKRVLFKFGFANRVAIYEQHKTGAECRGSEHEIILIWSLTSGKRQLFCDQKEIHYSCTHQNGWTSDTSWQHIFTLPDPMNNHHQRYRIHISTTRETQDPATHPFDVKVNNVSYFAFNPIYQLGTPRMMVVPLSSSSSSRHYHQGRSESPMSPEERHQLALAKLASLQDIAQQRNASSSNSNNSVNTSKDITQPLPQQQQQQQQQQDDLLISFGDEDKKDLAAAVVAPTPEHSISSIGFVASSSTTNLYQTNPRHASSITMDPNQSWNLEGGPPPPPPGNYYTSMNNPYGSTQPSYHDNINNSTSGNHTNPYSAVAPAGNTDTSTALTPYQPPAPTVSGSNSSNNPYFPSGGGGVGSYYNTSSSAAYAPAPPTSSSSNQPQSYIDATGRLNVGVPPPSIQTTSPWYNSTTATTTTTTNPYELQSPSATTVFTYGSAPSFAQPPKPPTSSTTTATSYTPYNNNDYSSYNNTGINHNPYGNTAPMSLSSTTTASPYGPPPPTTTGSTSTSLPLYPPPQPPTFASTPSYHY